MTGETNYRELLRAIIDTGFDRPDRTGTGTRALFGTAIKANLAPNRVPLLTGKSVPFRLLYGELLWMITGGNNARPLQERGISIWDEWADPETGDLGPVYGYQWRKWHGFTYEGAVTEIDQLKQVIQSLIKNPFGRRHIVSSWNVAMLEDMALPPCPVMFQFLVDKDYGLHCVVTQRSADMFLGVPFDLAEYGTLTHMIAQITGLGAKSVTLNFGDSHIYHSHFEQVREYLSRTPRSEPWLMIDPLITDIDHFGPTSIKVGGYSPHPAIPAPIAV